MPLDPAYKMTDAQIDCINQNLKEGVDLTQPGMRAGKAIGIHGLYGQQAPREIVEDAGFFDMLRMAGIEPRSQTEAAQKAKISWKEMDDKKGHRWVADVKDANDDVWAFHIDELQYPVIAAGKPLFSVSVIDPDGKVLGKTKRAESASEAQAWVQAWAQASSSEADKMIQKDFFAKKKTEGADGAGASEDLDPPFGYHKFCVEDVKFLMRGAGSPEWMIEGVSSEPVQRALDRMADAKDRGGIDGMVKDTAKRLKATKDADKILGLITAIEKIIVGDQEGMKPEQVKALRSIQADAKKVVGK